MSIYIPKISRSASITRLLLIIMILTSLNHVTYSYSQSTKDTVSVVAYYVERSSTYDERISKKRGNIMIDNMTSHYYLVSIINNEKYKDLGEMQDELFANPHYLNTSFFILKDNDIKEKTPFVFKRKLFKHKYNYKFYFIRGNAVRYKVNNIYENILERHNKLLQLKINPEEIDPTIPCFFVYNFFELW